MIGSPHIYSLSQILSSLITELTFILIKAGDWFEVNWVDSDSLIKKYNIIIMIECWVFIFKKIYKKAIGKDQLLSLLVVFYIQILQNAIQ